VALILLPRCSVHSWFTPFDSHEETSSPLEGYAHADGSSTANDQRATPGYAFPIDGGTVPRSLTQQETVPSPTAEGEYSVATHGGNEASWLRSLVSALFGTLKSPTTFLSETPAAAAPTRHRRYRPPAPHIDVRHHHRTRQSVEKESIPCSLPLERHGGRRVHQTPTFRHGGTFRRVPWTARELKGSVAEMAIGPDVIVSSRLDIIGPYDTDLQYSASFTVDSHGLSHILTPLLFASVDTCVSCTRHTDRSVHPYTQ